MEDDPIMILAEKLTPRGSGAGLLLGKVRTAPSAESPETPLTVTVGGTVQEAEDLRKNAALGALDFAAGDTLLLLPIEEAQRYIILCKVVSA